MQEQLWECIPHILPPCCSSYGNVFHIFYSFTGAALGRYSTYFTPTQDRSGMVFHIYYSHSGAALGRQSTYFTPMQEQLLEGIPHIQYQNSTRSITDKNYSQSLYRTWCQINNKFTNIWIMFLSITANVMNILIWTLNINFVHMTFIFCLPGKVALCAMDSSWTAFNSLFLWPWLLQFLQVIMQCCRESPFL